MKKRHTFVCWNCEETYTLMREFIAGQVLNVACPFCGEEGIVDLAPYSQATEIIYRQTAAQESSVPGVELPDILSTQPKGR